MLVQELVASPGCVCSSPFLGPQFFFKLTQALLGDHDGSSEPGRVGFIVAVLASGMDTNDAVPQELGEEAFAFGINILASTRRYAAEPEFASFLSVTPRAGTESHSFELL